MVHEVSKSLVTVIVITSETDCMNNSYENEGQNAGLIVADNGRELLILTEKEIVDQSEELNVVFKMLVGRCGRMRVGLLLCGLAG